VKQKRSRISDFYRKEKNRMISYVRSLINDVSDRDGEDVVQDVMLKIWDAADITFPLDKLSAYTYRSLKNKVIDLMRKGKKNELSLNAAYGNEENSSLQDILVDMRYDAESEVVREEMREMIYAALDQISKAEKEIVVLTEFDGKTFAECSDLLGEPAGTLYSRKSRAMKKIRLLCEDSFLYEEV
jgi:RNA polymerase sigma factor (sigma-70 family)